MGRGELGVNWGFVWMVAWPDFKARIRRFLIIGFGMALVLAITLLLSAFSEGFVLRSERLLGVFSGDEYVVAAGSAGPMTSSAPLPAALAGELEATGSVESARPILLAPSSILVDGEPAGAVVVGTDPEANPEIVDGRGLTGPGEAVIDEELYELALGDTFLLAGESFAVVGVTRYATWDIANAGIFIDRGQAQALLADGREVATAIAIDGTVAVTDLPPGVETQGRASAVADVLSRTADAKRSIDSFKITLWVLAVVIVGAVLYLAALERVGDFAIFKATGASNADLIAGLALQAVMVGVIAGVLSIGLAHVMKPIYPGLLSLPVSVAWPVIPVAVVIAVLSSVVGVRRAISVDPAQAFG